jgi:UDP-N-acetylmuramyl pentapeptide phosphotransferase/UDP-N-acetylglucosamine-1-phosphate transferase
MIPNEILYIFFINIILYFLFKKKLLKLVIKSKLVDRPGKNKIHKNAVPVTGGIVIFFSIIIFILYNLFFLNSENNFIDKRIVIILIGSFFVFFIGLIDDILNIKAQNKIIVITIFNILIFQNINYFQTSQLIFNNFLIKDIVSVVSFSLLISVIGFLTYHYSMVIMDGINGIFGAYNIFLFLILIFFFDLDSKFRGVLYYLTLILIFVTILNLKGDLFFGNSGSLMISTFTPYLLLYIYNERENNFSFLTFLSLMLIPIIDMTRLFFKRLFNRKNPFEKDLNHFHHLLVSKFSLLFSIFIYLMICFSPFLLIHNLSYDPFFVVMGQFFVFCTLIYFLKKNKSF